MNNPLDNTDLNLDPPGRGRIYGDITETIGNTPLEIGRASCRERV